MKKTRLLFKSFPFQGEVIKQGAKLSFKALTKDEKIFDIKDIEGIKVISVFPDINTPICIKQTKEFERLASLHKKLTFISICNNPTSHINKWSLSHGVKHSIVLSDKQYRDFGNKTNLYIPKRDQLGRGIIILDKNNKILSIRINKNLAKRPDYKYVMRLLK